MTASEITMREGFCNSCRLPLGKEFGRHKMMDSFNTLIHLFPECCMGHLEGKEPEYGFYCTKCALGMEKINQKIYNSYASNALMKEIQVEIRRAADGDVLGVDFVEA